MCREPRGQTCWMSMTLVLTSTIRHHKSNWRKQRFWLKEMKWLSIGFLKWTLLYPFSSKPSRKLIRPNICRCLSESKLRPTLATSTCLNRCKVPIYDKWRKACRIMLSKLRNKAVSFFTSRVRELKLPKRSKVRAPNKWRAIDNFVLLRTTFFKPKKAFQKRKRSLI